MTLEDFKFDPKKPPDQWYRRLYEKMRVAFNGRMSDEVVELFEPR